MYKRTGQSHHYLPRKGSYSTVPHRNGRVDILPPNARTPLYDIATQISNANERAGDLRQKRDHAKSRLHELQRIDRLRARVGSSGSESCRIEAVEKQIEKIDDEIRKVRRRANELKAILAGGSDLRFEILFVKLARVELPDDLYERLAVQANSILGKARE